MSETPLKAEIDLTVLCKWKTKQTANENKKKISFHISFANIFFFFFWNQTNIDGKYNCFISCADACNH